MTSFQRLCTFSFLLLFSVKVSAASFILNENCRKAYSLIWSYKIEEAQQLVQKERTSNPQNLFPVYLDGLSGFIRLFASGGKKEFEQYLSYQSVRLDKLSEGAEPYAGFCQA